MSWPVKEKHQVARAGDGSHCVSGHWEWRERVKYMLAPFTSWFWWALTVLRNLYAREAQRVTRAVSRRNEKTVQRKTVFCVPAVSTHSTGSCYVLCLHHRQAVA